MVAGSGIEPPFLVYEANILPLEDPALYGELKVAQTAHPITIINYIRTFIISDPIGNYSSIGQYRLITPTYTNILVKFC